MKTRSVAKYPAGGFVRERRKTRIRPRLVIGVLSVVLALWFASYTCQGGMYFPAELTATADSHSLALASLNTLAPTLTSIAESPTPVTPSPTATATELPSVTPQPTSTRQPTTTPPNAGTPEGSPILYYTQAGDTLRGLAARFGVLPEEITSPERIPTEGLFDPGVLLLIPPRLGVVSSSTPLLPDSEIVYSPSALDFKMEQFIDGSGGYLMTYREWRSDGWYDGPRVVQRVALENSINPRLLLAILEMQSQWVTSQPDGTENTDYPIGWVRAENEKKGLYYQLSWAVQQLNIGYYGWRDGTVTKLVFPDSTELRLSPDLNAGTVSLMYLFSRLYNLQEWSNVLYGDHSFFSLYELMFGNPWMRAQTVEPLFPATLTQPPLELPYLPGHTWSYTGGPHSAWGPDGARAAVDFAPSSVTHGCYDSDQYATAMSSGLVVRSENGVVVLDLDGDGYEQTGWVIMYLHIDTTDRVPLGKWVNLNDKIGHPSCEGGVSNGTHIHIARKYNGEWILADGPMPFVLSGWRVYADPIIYLGTMMKDGQMVYSSTVGSYESLVTRPKTGQ